MLVGISSFACTDRIFEIVDADVYQEFSRFGADVAAFIVVFHALDGNAITSEQAWKVTVVCVLLFVCT